jgi:hypothetical protein
MNLFAWDTIEETDEREKFFNLFNDWDDGEYNRQSVTKSSFSAAIAQPKEIHRCCCRITRPIDFTIPDMFLLPYRNSI